MEWRISDRNKSLMLNRSTTFAASMWACSIRGWVQNGSTDGRQLHFLPDLLRIFAGVANTLTEQVVGSRRMVQDNSRLGFWVFQICRPGSWVRHGAGYYSGRGSRRASVARALA